jgi:hypothetical protein
MIRSYRPGDSMLRLVLTEPREAQFVLRGRFLCCVFHLHGLTCRGRMDHWPTAEVKGRWLKGKWA